MDFPKANKPLSFLGASGNFNFSAEITPKQTKVGGVLTLVMKVTGTGNLDMVVAPGITADGFRIYQPELEASKDAKIFKQILIPEQDGNLAIEEIEFSFFNPQLK